LISSSITAIIYYKPGFISIVSKGVLMKGCLSLIIKIIIAVLVFFGLKYLGVIDFIQEKTGAGINSALENRSGLLKQALDLSGISSEYTIEKNIKILKTGVISVQHNASGQRIIIIEPNNEDTLSKQDIIEGGIKEKLSDFSEKYTKNLLQFKNIQTLEQGQFQGAGQDIPFVKIEAEISNLPLKDIEGIIGVLELKGGKNLIIISFNEKNKYSQIITDAFFKDVKIEEKI